MKIARLILCASAAALLLGLPLAGGSALAYSSGSDRPAAASAGGAKGAATKGRATKPAKAKKPAKATKKKRATK